MIEELAPSEAIAEQARMLIDVRRYDQAIALLSSGLGTAPTNARLLYLRAIAAHALRKNDDAYEDVCEALRHRPADYASRRLLARLLIDKRRFPDAEAILIDLLKEYPKDAELFARYAALMLRTGHFDKAAALNRQALAIEPENETALISQHLLNMIHGENAAADETIGEMIHAHPESAAVAAALITHLSRQGKYRSARRIAIGLLASSPTQPEYLNLVRQLTFLSHWSMLPAWPFMRWGRLAMGVFYLVTIVAIRVGAAGHQALQMQLTVAFIVCVIYINVWPRALRRWINR